MFFMKSTNKILTIEFYLILKLTVKKSLLHEHKGFKLGNHNKWTFDLKGERMSGILYTLIGDGTWPKKRFFQEKNL